MLDLHLDLPDAHGRRAAIELALRAAIQEGRLPAGSPVPSSRSLACDLGVARSTVVAAYEQLTAEGYLRSVRGSGTVVGPLRAIRAPESEADLFPPTPKHDFRPGEPDAEAFPRLRWLRSVRRTVTSATTADLGYPDPRGVPDLRTAVAGHLGRTRSVVADRTAVRVVGGYAAALGFIADTFRHRGIRRIAVEDPMLPVHVHVLRAAGLETVPIPVDREGLDVTRLRLADVDAAIVTPAHQYPLGVTMSADRRTDLVDWSRETDAWLVEDDYDGEFRYDRRPIGALQGLAPDRVIYAGTASKSLSPALRMAWMVVPRALRAHLLHVSNARPGVSGIDQLALADFIESGELDRHLRSMRTKYAERNTMLRTALAEAAPWLELGGGSAGLHLAGLLLDDRLDERTVLAATDAASVGILGLRTHHRSTTAPGVAIGFSRLPDHGFNAGLDRLCEVFGSLSSSAGA